MAAVTYSRTSPYFTTNANGTYLDLMNYRKILFRVDDATYTVEKTFEYRPDLLAFSIYNNASLWWVFQARNPNVITDPIGDFVAGTVIRVPKLQDLQSQLGL
jgi:hypothetical protein